MPVILRVCAIVALCGSLQSAPDPIEGKWAGEAGFATDRAAIGFEFKRDAKGELRGYLYQSVINFYGLELPGPMKRDGSKYVNDDYRLTLTLSGDTLEGTYFPLNAPITLKRVTSLPAEVPVPALPAGPGPKWQKKLGGAIYAPAAIRDGIAYVATTSGVFYAVNAADGEVRWTFNAGQAMYGEPLATPDAVFFVCDNGFLFKLDRTTGKETWRYDLGDARTSRVLIHAVIEDFDMDVDAPMPVLVDNTVFVGAGDGGFHAVDAATGKRVWRAETGGKIRTAAVVHGANIITGSWDGTIYAFERATGQDAWKKPTGAQLTSTPALAGNLLIAGNRGGLLAAIDTASSKTAWRMLFWGSAVESDPVVDGETVYIGSSDLRRITALAPADGRVLWRTDVFGFSWARPLVTPTTIFASAMGTSPYQMRHLGSLSALDRKTGAIVWRWAMPEWPGSIVNGFAAAPVLAGDLVIVGGVDGSLYAFPSAR